MHRHVHLNAMSTAMMHDQVTMDAAIDAASVATRPRGHTRIRTMAHGWVPHIDRRYSQQIQRIYASTYSGIYPPQRDEPSHG